MQKKKNRIFFSVLALLGPGRGPGRPDFARFRVLAPNFCTGNRPGPIRGLFFFFWDWPDPKICQFSEFSCTEYSGSLGRSEGMGSTPMAMAVIWNSQFVPSSLNGWCKKVGFFGRKIGLENWSIFRVFLHVPFRESGPICRHEWHRNGNGCHLK